MNLKGTKILTQHKPINYSGYINSIYYYFPIRKTLVPQLGHEPCVAGLPFFNVIVTGFFISRFDLHLKQYACIKRIPLCRYIKRRYNLSDAIVNPVVDSMPRKNLMLSIG